MGLGPHCCCFPLEGYIKNTEKLNYGKEHQYKLTVTAYDCGKKRATEDVLVKISIKPTCTPGWQGECRPLLLPSHLFLNLSATETGSVFSSLSPPRCGPTQDGTAGSSTSLARALWPSSQTPTWRRVMSPWPPCRRRWSWRPAT